MRGGSRTCSGSRQSFLNRLKVSEFKVQKTPGHRGGGASLQVRLTPPTNRFSHLFPSHPSAHLGLSGVDDAESECGLDSGVEFDWNVINEADAPLLDEQLRPILQLAEEAASSSSVNRN